MNQPSTKARPFFSRRLIPCAPDGSYSGFTFRRKVSFAQNGLFLGKMFIDPAYIEELLAYGPILRVRYGTSSGKPVEVCFWYSTFLEATATAALREAVSAATDAWADRFATAVPLTAEARAPSIDSLPSGFATPGRNPRVRVNLPSAKAAFPTLCPVCSQIASHVAVLNASAGDNERGSWLVPTCGKHQIKDSIRLEKWRANATEISFSFANSEYARQFAVANDIRQDSGPKFDRARLHPERRFVIYSYVISAVYFSLMMQSRIFAVEETESRVLPGLRYSLLTLGVGWWAIPGIFFSIRALAQNFRGGLDVTDLAHRAFAGHPLSAYGVD